MSEAQPDRKAVQRNGSAADEVVAKGRPRRPLDCPLADVTDCPWTGPRRRVCCHLERAHRCPLASEVVVPLPCEDQGLMCTLQFCGELFLCAVFPSLRLGRLVALVMFAAPPAQTAAAFWYTAAAGGMRAARRVAAAERRVEDMCAAGEFAGLPLDALRSAARAPSRSRVVLRVALHRGQPRNLHYTAS